MSTRVAAAAGRTVASAEHACGSRIAAYAIVFLSGVAVMVLEIVAGRLAAQHVGGNLYTWTSIIGVVLGGLTIGNLWGGWLADRVPRDRTLLWCGVSFAVASVSSFLVLWTHWHVFDLPLGEGLIWPLRILLGMTLSFLVPSIALGMVSPLAGKWALDQSADTGRVLGALFGWGSLGAILGTLLAGFVLVPFLGSTTVIAMVGFCLAAIATLIVRRVLMILLLAVATALMIGVVSGGPKAREARIGLGLETDAPTPLVTVESAYQRIEVRERRGGLREVWIDSLLHGWVHPFRPQTLGYRYLRNLRILSDITFAGHVGPDALILGGGAFNWPRYHVARWPGATVTVAEIDPSVTHANRVATGLGRTPGFTIIHQDARRAVQSAAQRGQVVDMVLLDVFRDHAVPPEVTTREFAAAVDGILSEDGIFAVLVIDTWPAPRFLATFAHTVAQVFPYVEVVGTSGADPDRRDTFLVIASRMPLPVTAAAEQDPRFVPIDRAGLLAPLHGGRVLTDDHAPVEHLMALWRR